MSVNYVDKLFSIVDRKRSSYIEILKEAVSIKSVVGDSAESTNVIAWAERKLKKLGASTTQFGVGEFVYEGKRIKLPPVLVADVKSETAKATLLVYGHLDVKPLFSANETNFNSKKAFTLTEEDGILFGSGVTDSKGPLLCWFNAIEAYLEMKVDIPVNIRFVIEAMKESGSVGLTEFLNKNKSSLFKNVSYICISDSSCTFSSKPVITYGLRGCCKFVITVVGANCNLHSGVHGGMVSEPMTDILYLLSSLVNSKGQVLIPDIHSHVEDVTPEEERSYHKLTFDVAAFKRSIGVERLLHKDDKKRLLMHRSRFPSLSIHGITSSVNNQGDEIPCKVSAYFTIRIVPNQTPDEVFHKVQLYMTYLFSKSQSPNQMSLEMLVGKAPWLANPDDVIYKSAKKAIQRVYKQEPDVVREGSCIPIIRDLQDISGKTVLLLPVGCSEHSVTNNRDRIDVKTFMDGTKVVVAFLHELSLLKAKV